MSGKPTVLNPYLLGTPRLADVIAGIQFLGGYKFYKISLTYWEDRIKFPPKSAKSWEELFRQHPEFFRVSEEERNVCLMLRRARTKNFNVDTLETISKDERRVLSSEQKKRITRQPLNTNDITALISTAVELHSRSIEHQQESRWYLPLIPSIVGLTGVILGAGIGIIAE